MASFSNAFAAARKAGKSEFTWKGKRYHTRVKGEKKAPKKGPVPTGRPKQTAKPKKQTAKANVSQETTGSIPKPSKRPSRSAPGIPKPTRDPRRPAEKPRPQRGVGRTVAGITWMQKAKELFNLRKSKKAVEDQPANARKRLTGRNKPRRKSK